MSRYQISADTPIDPETVFAMMRERVSRDRKFELADVDDVMRIAATHYLDRYVRDVRAGRRRSFDFLNEMVRNTHTRKMTDGQVKGVANCWRHEVLADSAPTLAPGSAFGAGQAGADVLLQAMAETPVIAGQYLFDHPDGGDMTLRFRLPSFGDFGPETLMAEVKTDLSQTGWEGFAFVKNSMPKIWKKHQDRALWTSGLLHFLGMPHAERMSRGERFANASGCCWRCGKGLTVATSLYRGLGPDCARILGVK